MFQRLAGLTTVVGLVAACAGGPTWESVAAENAAGMDYLRGALLVVKAEIDKNPDVSTYPKCVPSPEYKYSPLGPWMDHTIDFLDYSRLETGGLPVFRSREDSYAVLPETSLSKALFWTHPNNPYSPSTAFAPALQVGYPAPTPTDEDIARIYAVQALKYLVVTRDRPGSNAGHVRVDAFLVALNPTKVQCALSVSADGEQEGTAPVAMVEVTVNTRTNQVVSTREYTEGGYTTTDVSYNARTDFAYLAYDSLGVTTMTCNTDGQCSPFGPTSCVAHACVFDPKVAAAAAADRTFYETTVRPLFEAQSAKYDECERLRAIDTEAGDFSRTSPSYACSTKYWDDVHAEGARVGVSKADVDRFADTWRNEHTPGASR